MALHKYEYVWVQTYIKVSIQFTLEQSSQSSTGFSHLSLSTKERSYLKKRQKCLIWQNMHIRINNNNNNNYTSNSNNNNNTITTTATTITTSTNDNNKQA